MNSPRGVLAAILIGTLGTASLTAGIPVGLFSTFNGHSTAEVPGVTDAEFTYIGRPYRSPDGSKWILQAVVTGSPLTSDILVVGGGPTSAGASVVLREGSPAPWAPGENVGDFSPSYDYCLGINDNGHFAFSNNTDGDVNGDEYIVKYDGSWGVVAREGTVLPAPYDTQTFGTALSNVHILNDGRVGYHALSTFGPAPDGQDDFLFLGDSAIVHEGVSIPAGQIGGTTHAWDNFDPNDYWHDATGMHSLVQGDIETLPYGEDDVVVVDGNVVIQEGHPLPGSAFNTVVDDDFLQAAMMANGDWFARGGNDDGLDWLVRNGTVLAQCGDILPGAAEERFDDERFDPTFFLMAGNNVGECVFGARTNAEDETRDAVLVYDGPDGQYVVLRSGAPIDLDGNGLFDDDVFIESFDTDACFLTDAQEFYFTADMINAAGMARGQALVVLNVPEPGTMIAVLLGGVVLLRRRL